jgi:flagella basal body P-ring formation protein FlgA
MLGRVLLLLALPTAATAESLVAARTIPAGTVLAQEDVMLVDAEIPGALTEAAPALGQQARIAIYAGRPVRAADVAAPALIERNARVVLLYRSGGLTITAEGRALDKAAEGEAARALNLSSKSTVSGLVLADGTILVGGTP